jgi:hypothetical protein
MIKLPKRNIISNHEIIDITNHDYKQYKHSLKPNGLWYSLYSSWYNHITFQDMDYKIKDISLAAWGHKEMAIAETEMPGLIAVREEFKEAQPLRGAVLAGRAGGGDRDGLRHLASACDGARRAGAVAVASSASR